MSLESTPHTQLALFLDSPKGDWVLGERNVPKPEADEVLVRLLATGLNPSEWKTREYAPSYITEYPAVLGVDGAGEVVEVGKDVQYLAKGDKIFFEGLLVNNKATLQQYVLVPAEVAAKVPPNLTIEQAATISVALVTAALGIYGNRKSAETLYAPWLDGGLDKYRSKPIVIFGGSTNVGNYAIQLAQLSGFSPIITTSSPRHKDALTALGATHVIDRDLPDIPRVIQGIITGQHPQGGDLTNLMIVLDTVSSAETQRAAYSILSAGGLLVLVLPPVFEPAEGKYIDVVFGNAQIPQNRKSGAELFAKLEDWFGRGVLKPIDRVEVLPGGLSAVAAGLKRLENGEVSRAKLVIRPTETVRL